MSLRRVLHPVLLLDPVAASALAWSVPGSSTVLRGFAHRAEAAPGGLALLVAWYLMCATILVLGHRIGAATPPAASLARYETDPVLERRLFRLLWVSPRSASATRWCARPPPSTCWPRSGAAPATS